MWFASLTAVLMSRLQHCTLRCKSHAALQRLYGKRYTAEVAVYLLQPYVVQCHNGCMEMVMGRAFDQADSSFVHQPQAKLGMRPLISEAVAALVLVVLDFTLLQSGSLCFVNPVFGSCLLL